DMFVLALPVLEKILRPVIVYFFLIIGLRLAGKGELAQVRHESAQTEANPRRISQATAESALHSRGSPIRSGRVRFNRASRFWCSALGLVIRRKRISRASVVGKTISALCKVESRAKALAGDISIFFPRSR